MPVKGRTAAALILMICLLATAAAATMHTEVTSPALEMTVTVGYDGMITYGKAFPVRVRIRNNGEDFEGRVGVNAYITKKNYDRYETDIVLPAGTEREYVLAPSVYIKQETFTAEITKDGEVLCAVNAKPRTIANPSAMLVGVLSTRPQSLNYLNISQENDTLGRYEYWQTVALTPEDFPDDQALMNSFGMIVIDDVDPAALSQTQKTVLDKWLRSGRILICGGTAGVRTIEYFSGYTGLKVLGAEKSDGVIAGLEKSIGRAESGSGTDTMLALLEGPDPLAQDAGGRGLVYRTCVDSGRIYTAAFEPGDARLNAESVMHYYWEQLLVNIDQDNYTSALYSSGSDLDGMQVYAQNNMPLKVQSRIFPGALAVAGMLVLAGAAWFILKHMDRKQWMWLVLPVLSAAAAACLVLIAGSSETNRPMAVITENTVQDSSGAVRSFRSVTAAMPEYGRHTYAMGGDKLRLQDYDYVDYDEEEDTAGKEPTILRTNYLSGGENAVTAAAGKPWQTVSLSCESEPVLQGRADARVWMEEDGLHGLIANRTESRLTEGRMITSYGYVSVPDLNPGEEAEVILTPKTVADPQDPKYEEGGLYLDNTAGFYTMIYAAFGITDAYTDTPTDNVASVRTTMVSNASDQMRRRKNGGSYSSVESAQFIYCAVPEGLPEIGLSADGKPVERKAEARELTAEMTWQAVGRTGIVFRSAGMDMPVRMKTDEKGMPTGETMGTGRTIYYHTLSDTPTFRYDLSGLTDIRIEKLQITMEAYYETQVKCFALNAETNDWENVQLNKKIENPEKYLNKAGELYLQFRADTQDMYAEIPTPLMMLEGRVSNAAD